MMSTRKGRNARRAAVAVEAEVDEIDCALSIDDCNSLNAVAGSNSSLETITYKKSKMASCDSSEEQEVTAKKSERAKRTKKPSPELDKNITESKKKPLSKKQVSAQTVSNANKGDVESDVNDDKNGELHRNTKSAKSTASSTKKTKTSKSAPKGRQQRKEYLSDEGEEENVKIPAPRRGRKKVDKSPSNYDYAEVGKKQQPKKSLTRTKTDEIGKGEDKVNDAKPKVVAKRGKKAAGTKGVLGEAAESKIKLVEENQGKPIEKEQTDVLETFDIFTKPVPKSRNRGAAKDIISKELINDEALDEDTNIDDDKLPVAKKQKQLKVKEVTDKKGASTNEKLITEPTKPKGRKRGAVKPNYGDDDIISQESTTPKDKASLEPVTNGRQRAAVKKPIKNDIVQKGIATEAEGKSEPIINVAPKGKNKQIVKESSFNENIPPAKVAPKGRKRAAAKETIDEDTVKKETNTKNEEEVTIEPAKSVALKGRKRIVKKENDEADTEAILGSVQKESENGAINEAMLKQENETHDEASVGKPTKNSIVKGRKRVAVKESIQSENDDGKKPKLNPSQTLYDEVDFSIKDDYKLKISSWNVAGLRAWLTKGGLQYIDHEKPDILCLQETKCVVDQLPDSARIPGYHPYWLCNPGGHAGVAIYSKVMPINVEYGINDKEQDEKGRIITAEYEKFYLVCVYVPNAGRKLVTLPSRMRWDAVFQEYVTKLDKKKPVIICGDMNVAHEEIDLANPKTNKKNAGFTQEERDGMTKLLSLGFVDTFRQLYPDKEKCYSFWSYMGNARSKNVGWRLDYFILSKRICGKVVENTMRTKILGSDHCPITLFLNQI